jgi:TPR repeat protein
LTKYFKLSFEQGDFYGSYLLGKIYYTGEGGITKDWISANMYLRFALDTIKNSSEKFSNENYSYLVNDMKKYVYEIYFYGGWGIIKNEIEATKWQ